MEKSRKKITNKVVLITNLLAVVLYLISSCLGIQRQWIMTLLGIWGIYKIYNLSKWKENRKYDNFFNLFVLIIIAMVLAYEIHRLY